ncbi:MAG: hypothetical protein ACK5Z3_16675 [Pseudanabaena sp.]|jgi:hypothetical protein
MTDELYAGQPGSNVLMAGSPFRNTMNESKGSILKNPEAWFNP